MGPKLNPDGAKIRALRMQRGWTQEQLAEIAGVSARTIQRAEAAGCAGFETLRAVAGAFESDFDALLKSDPPVSLTQAAPPVRRTWTTLRVAAAALAAGLLTGGIFVYRVHTPDGLHFPAYQPGPMVAARARSIQETRPPAATPVKTPGTLRTAARPAGPQSEPAPALESPTTIPSPPEPASLGLPRPSRELLSLAVMPKRPGGWNAPKDSIVVAGPGAVRQAVGQAAKKTGGFLSRIGESTRRAF